MSIGLQALRDAAHREGWAQGNATLTAIQYTANLLGWKEVRSRSSDPTVAELVPRDTQRANPRSLSAEFGLGAQPLHTDGAHLTIPPDIVILHSEEPNNTPTLLWDSRPTYYSLRVSPRDAIAHGVFLVDSGRESFFATAKLKPNHIRYDPGCMSPCDQRARASAKYFADVEGEARKYEWSTRNNFVMIDNRMVLHARADATDDHSRLLKRLMYRTLESS